ncbi:MAG: hypothetical protein M3Y56_05595, partial [Armatimonadota bacterium]|nr:hypothetical protein [Armatimonadota bacterium]
YLRQFARDAAACAGPVFLRFASEMNGNWTNYHNDPALYRAKFRLVHDVMARWAPNVAMMWCVYEVPEYNIDSYYPGDAYVDWVGINIYSVLHHNNSAGDVSEYENPASMLKYIYNHYASRKPIAICEYAASHRESMATSIDCSRFAKGKLADIFTALPRKFPRVKLIDIFDCNNIKYGRQGRQVNDYCVTDDPGVLNEFQRLVASDYYLSSVVNGPQAQLPQEIQPLQQSTTLRDPIRLTAWVKSYENQPIVTYWLDGKKLASFNTPGEYPINLEFARIGPGVHKLRLEALDAAGKTAASKEATLSLPGVQKGSVPT